MYFKVEEIFTNTIQGEGYHAGLFCDFVRLYGCPVGCYFCDQGYNDGGINNGFEKLTPERILKRLGIAKTVILTGGEPLIEKNVRTLIKFINFYGRIVHIETSGIKWQEIRSPNWITLSPKTHLNNKFKVEFNWWERADEIKLIISEGNELDYYPEIREVDCPVYLQPEWNKKEEIMPTIMELLSQNQNFKLSQQTHKFANLP